LASALDEGEWLASRPVRFTAREGAPVTDWIGGWVGPRDADGLIWGTFLQLHVKCFLSSHRVCEKIQIQNSGGISNHENVIYNFKVQMLSFNKVFDKIIILLYD
jgi:hypothetical protein